MILYLFQVKSLQEDEKHQPVKENPRQETASDTDDSGDDFLPDQHPSDMAFFHSEDIVEREFFFSSFNQKTVGVKEKNRGEQSDHDHSQPQNHLSVLSGSQSLIGVDTAHVEKHSCSGDARQQKRQIKLSVFSDIAESKSQIEVLSHYRSPPVASTVRVSEMS